MGFRSGKEKELYLRIQQRGSKGMLASDGRRVYADAMRLGQALKNLVKGGLVTENNFRFFVLASDANKQGKLGDFT